MLLYPIPHSSCLPLPSDHPCYNLTGRDSNHALSETRAVDINKIVHLIGFAITSSMEDRDPEECQSVMRHYLCLISVPPCDPVSQQPLPICDRNCEAYKKLVADGRCDNSADAVRDLAAEANYQDIFLALDLYEKFDCENMSTYYHFETDVYTANSTCTNLLNMHSEGQ